MKSYAKLTVEVIKRGRYYHSKVGDILEINKNFKNTAPVVGDEVSLGPVYGKNTMNHVATGRVVAVHGVGCYDDGALDFSGK